MKAERLPMRCINYGINIELKTALKTAKISAAFSKSEFVKRMLKMTIRHNKPKMLAFGYFSLFYKSNRYEQIFLVKILLKIS